MVVFLCILILAFCVLLFLLLKKIEKRERIVIAVIFLTGYFLTNPQFFPFSWFPGALLLALPPGSETICYEEDVTEAGRQMLWDCFGKDAVLSEGVKKERRYFDECDGVNIIQQYKEWTLSYRNVEGKSSTFVFDNCRWEFNEKSIENAMEEYFSELTEEFYKEKFWNETVAGISGFREADSTLDLREYSISASRDVPESSVMYDNIQQYSLADNIDFTQIQYQDVFKKFPYRLNLYLYVDYESSEKQKRERQCEDTERKLRQMTEKMISYTDHSLNAVINVTMMDEDGYADAFRIAIVGGEYFINDEEDGYEIALYENFFGSESR